VAKVVFRDAAARRRSFQFLMGKNVFPMSVLDRDFDHDNDNYALTAESLDYIHNTGRPELAAI
jgi:hypothetical protein